jgi:hypothetical protein
VLAKIDSTNYNTQWVNAGIPAAHAASHVSGGSDPLSVFSTSTTTSGLVPGSNGVGSTYFLNAAGAWAVPPVGFTQAAADLLYVNVAGDTMTGNLVLDVPSGASDEIILVTKTTDSVVIKAATVPVPTLQSQVRGNLQWGDNGNGSLAAGPQSGTTLLLRAGSGGDMTDVLLGNTGVTVTQPLTLPSADPTTPTQAAHKQYVDKRASQYLTINPQAGTSYTVVLADAGSLVNFSSATAVTVTVPANSTTAFPVGSRIDMLQSGAGKVTIAGAGGVTVNPSTVLGFRAQWSAATLIKTATDTWVLSGDTG